MLDAKNDRLFYDELLKAPEGFVFSHAVTTSYSLDLDAILLIPVALYFSSDLDFHPSQTRDDVLEALSKCSKQISIFCQRGKIKVPQPYNKLMAFWEKGIYQIQMPSFNQSFHPKIWIIRYQHRSLKSKVYYRFLCTSRNLTFSRDWDLAVSAQGEVGSQPVAQNRELVETLKWLQKPYAGSIPDSFFKELPKVAFDLPQGFNQMAFHPIGINGSLNPVFKDHELQDERLVMSPFLDHSTLQDLAKHAKQSYLFSSRFEMLQLQQKTLELFSEKFQFSPVIEDAEKDAALSEADEIPMSQNLHAKLFIDKKGSQVTWYLGSANATQPANKGNVEFMVSLRTTASKGPTAIKKELTTSMSNGTGLFEAFTEQKIHAELSSSLEQQIRRLRHDLGNLPILGEATLQNGKYDLQISIPEVRFGIPAGLEIRCKPIAELKRAAVKLQMNQAESITVFGAYVLIELSPYLIFEIWEGENQVDQFVLDMQIDLSEDRLDKIFNSIINSKAKFLNYLHFLMSEETPNVHGSDSVKTERYAATHDGQIAFFSGSPIYEQLLFTASRSPEKLASIETLIERSKTQYDEEGNPLVTPELLTMWQAFSEFKGRK